MAFTSESLKVFLAVIDSGSFSAAARKLGRVPSAINMAVSQLEAELADRKQTTGGFQFGLGEVLPDELVAKLVTLRIKELSEKYPDLDFTVTK